MIEELSIGDKVNVHTVIYSKEVLDTEIGYVTAIADFDEYYIEMINRKYDYYDGWYNIDQLN